MKLGLFGINARYTHSNLAIKYLKEDLKDIIDADIYDFSINDSLESVLNFIVEEDFDLIGISVYIWNVEFIKELVNALKTIDPSITIFLGGPEVSYETADVFKEINTDYIMLGDGEGLVREFIETKLENQGIDHPSIISRGNPTKLGTINRSKNLIPIYLDSKYIEDNKYVYYEASRGCPYNCAFCLSSASDKTVFKDIDAVKKEIDTFIKAKVPIVKLIDRSFNFNPHSIEIMSYIKEVDEGHTTFHLEIHPSLIDDKFIDLVKSSRPKLFQFEIGLQTTSDKTANEIKRAGSYEEIKDVCLKIQNTSSHVHMDLIAGLPYEDLPSLEKSFNDLYEIGPDKIQLGFLKLLKGSRLRALKEDYGYKFFPKAPYEVISNKWMTYKDIIEVKAVESMVDKYYNEGYFYHSLKFIISEYYKSPWSFFKEISSFYKDMGMLYRSISRLDLYNFLYDFLKETWNVSYLSELIIYDYYLNDNKRSSKFKLVNYHKAYDRAYLLDLIKLNQEELEEDGLDSKNILKKSVIEIFPFDKDLNFNGKDNYHIFVKDGESIRNYVLKEGQC